MLSPGLPDFESYALLFSFSDETLPIINKPRHPKEGEYKEENGTTSEKTKEPPKRKNRKGNLKFLNLLLSQEHIK